MREEAVEFEVGRRGSTGYDKGGGGVLVASVKRLDKRGAGLIVGEPVVRRVGIQFSGFEVRNGSISEGFDSAWAFGVCSFVRPATGSTFELDMRAAGTVGT